MNYIHNTIFDHTSYPNLLRKLQGILETWNEGPLPAEIVFAFQENPNVEAAVKTFLSKCSIDRRPQHLRGNDSMYHPNKYRKHFDDEIFSSQPVWTNTAGRKKVKTY